MTITENTLDVDALKWFYREAAPINPNDKPPILFLHGLPSQSFSWCEIMSVLADSGLRAIAPDWIGSGLSAKPEKRDFPYTPEAYLKALSDFIQALNLKKFSLVVQGFLASVGLQYAFRYPDTINRLIILNTPLSTAAKLPWAMQQWGLPLVGEMLTQDPLLVDRTLEGGSGFVIADNNLAYYRQPFLKTSAVGRALQATIKNLNLSKSMAELEAGFSHWEKLTLIVWGMADPWLSSTYVETLASSQPNVELVKLAEAKHYPQEHWSKEISPEILDFLRRQAL